jgi:hypothetical protein
MTSKPEQNKVKRETQSRSWLHHACGVQRPTNGTGTRGGIQAGMEGLHAWLMREGANGKATPALVRTRNES